MGQAKTRASASSLVWHHTTTLRTNLIWMSGVVDVEGNAKPVLHPRLGNISNGASLRRSMRDFPPLAWFTSRIEPPKCLTNVDIVLTKPNGQATVLPLSGAKAAAINLDRLALGFDPVECGIVPWKTHAGYATAEGTELNDSAIAIGDDPDDWWVSDHPVDVAMAAEVRIAKSRHDLKMMRSDTYLQDVKRMVRMCRETPGVCIPPTWLPEDDAQLVARRLGVPVADVR